MRASQGGPGGQDGRDGRRGPRDGEADAGGDGAEGAVGGGVELGGYRQELKRTLGSFQVFAISFAFISVAVGVFATYDEVLRSSGPVGIWLWPIAAVGQTLVALVVAQFAARIPLSGSSYQWASRLASPRIGWWFGWLTFCYLAIAVVAIDNALASQAFMPLAGIAADEDTARVITLVVLLVQAVLAIASTRLVGWINSAAVGLEVVLVIVVAIALAIAVAVSGGDAGNLTSRGVAAEAPGYFGVGGGLMLAMIMGLATLVGFDSAANLAEEAKDPHRSVPRAIVGSVVAAGILGMIFLITLTLAIEDLPRISAEGSPVAAIMRDRLGPAAEEVLLVAISFAFFGAGIVVMVACSRLVYAMSRDARFPAHRLMRRVSPRTRTPVPATLLILVLGFVLMVALPGAALLELITASTILPALIYGATIVLYLAVRGRLGRRKGAFDLGRLELPVAVCALVWTLLALFVLVTPAEALVPVVVVAGLLLVGGLFFLGTLLFGREALDTEPGGDTRW
ncbi:APC family permease [Streptomyces sp. NPDC056491]|uniref:APC family permease n=1 Tax=Streptomyces sp. NPDC056491 TaxID=3345837 RepID=UPI0036CE92A7